MNGKVCRYSLVWAIASAAVVVLTGCQDGGSGGDASPTDYSTATRTTEIPPGAVCPAGGVQIDTGIDENGNGVLDDDEVDETVYVCHGLSGLYVLSEEPPGENCPDGGVKIETGLDTNGNGLLDAEEITGVSYDCEDRPPAPVSGFTAVSIGAGVQLSWEDPPDVDLEEIVVRRRSDGFYPVDETDGVLVGTISPGLQAAFDTAPAAPGDTHHYAAFAKDLVLVSDAARTTATRFHPGTLDPGYGDGAGYALADGLLGAGGVGHSVAVDGEDRILVGGRVYDGFSEDMALWADEHEESPEILVEIEGKGDDAAYATAVDADGNILLAGTFTDGDSGTLDMILWRLTPEGEPDMTFGEPGGYVIFSGERLSAGGDTDETNDVATGVVVDTEGTGNIYVVGNSAASRGGTGHLLLWAVTPEGFLDKTFGEDLFPVDGAPDGFVAHTGTAGGTEDAGNAVTLDQSGNVLVAGYSMGTRGDRDMVVWRFLPDGTLDVGNFGGDVATPEGWDGAGDGIADGFLIHDDAAGGAGDDEGLSIADAVDWLLVTGYSDNGADRDLVVWRLLSETGLLDTADFNNPNGFLVRNGTLEPVGDDQGNAVREDVASGNILVAGSTFDGVTENMVLWRFLPDGTDDTTFGGELIDPGSGARDGFLLHDLEGDERALGMTQDRFGRVVLTGFYRPLDPDAAPVGSAQGHEIAIWRVVP